MGRCDLGSSEQKRNAYVSFGVDFRQVYGSSNGFLACIGECMDLPWFNGSESNGVIAPRNGHILEVGECASPTVPAVAHVLREWIVPAESAFVFRLLSHDDELLQNQVSLQNDR